jgi:hypothetical protein
MKKIIGVYVLLSFTMGSLAQNIVLPHGQGYVVFWSPGGRWQEAVITDQLTGESTAAYSLEAEPGATDAGTGRHPKIEFSCQTSGKFDGIWIRTGTVVANQFSSPHDHSSGRAQVSTRSDSQKTKTWIANIGRDGSDLVANQGIISDLIGHKRLVIRFKSASGATIVDQYLTEGLSSRWLKGYCPALFAKK